MRVLDILEGQERDRMERMSLKQASDAVMRGIYTVEEITAVNHKVKTVWNQIKSSNKTVGWGLFTHLDNPNR